MRKKYKLKPWVKILLLLLPEIIIILQLFIISNKISDDNTIEPQINIENTILSGGSHV